MSDLAGLATEVAIAKSAANSSATIVGVLSAKLEAAVSILKDAEYSRKALASAVAAAEARPPTWPAPDCPPTRHARNRRSHSQTKPFHCVRNST